MARIPNTQTGTLGGNDHGTDDDLAGGGILYGDALEMVDHARGGNDVLTATGPMNILRGDAQTIRGNSIGGNDVLIGKDGATHNSLQGDAQFMQDDARGGNDVLIGGAGATTINRLQGDAPNMLHRSRGGNDLVIGGDDALENHLFGDSTSDLTIGGNDLLIGGNGAGINRLFGDAARMNNEAHGGNDVLIAGNNAGSNDLYGDAEFLLDGAVCGKDTLISGNTIDNMWGDGAEITGYGAITRADTFVFMPGNSADKVHDFRQIDHDRIDIRAYGFGGIADLDINVVGGDIVIDFGSGNSVTLVGFADPLRASDFIF